MNVAIAGYGNEGAENYRYWTAQGHEVIIFDEKEVPSMPLPKDAAAVLGEGAFGKMGGCELVVRTASLAPSKLTSGGKVWSATNEFFARCPAPIIGVTGTKGKGTTCSMTAEILRAAGRTAWLVGNIGVPALGKLPDITAGDIVVFELSSFQLWDITASPHIAGILGIEPDHLDIHADVDDYLQAKGRITAYQTADDVLVFKPSNTFSAQLAAGSHAVTVGYGPHGTAQVRDGYFWYGEQRLCPVSVLGVPGAHNAENACAAIALAWPYVQDADTIVRGLSAFKGLPHHIELVRQLEGVSYYDDSFSATPMAAVVAMRAFIAPEVVLLGGYDRGTPLDEIVEAARQLPNIKHMLLLGQTRHRLQQLCDQLGERRYEVLDGDDFTAMVGRARALAEPGDVVLLSPGCPSFDMFDNFYQRGERFQGVVRGWKEEGNDEL